MPLTASHRHPVLHLWMPEIFGFKGGIQVYSAFLLRGLQEIMPQATYRVLLKHDTRSLLRTAYVSRCHAHTYFHGTGDWPHSLRTGAFATQLLRYGLCDRPDLVIATHLNFTPVAYWLKRLRGVPYWVIAHGVEAWTIENKNLWRSLRLADKILAVGAYTRHRLASELHVSPTAIGLLPNTFDAGRFHIGGKPEYLLQRYGLQANQKLILTVARLADAEQYKGYDQIVRALPGIRMRIPNVHYILVGKGNDRTRVEELAAVLNVQDIVTFAGFVPDEELCDHYNLCDLFAMPSKGEGFGIVYLEALACGKPVLGGDQDGAVDALCQGELGVLVDPDSVKDIVDTIVAILQGEYSHELLYNPQALRAAVTEKFGFAQFMQTLDTHFRKSGQTSG